MSVDLEHRAVVEVRARGTKIVGYAVVFDTRSEDLGGFREVVKPQAVDQAVLATANIVALFNHDPGAVLGRTPHTLTVSKDARGLAFELDPAPTQAGKDAYALVERGDIRAASFGFKTLKENWRQDAGVMIRELLAIDIAEVSLVAFPAYSATDVSVALRSLRAIDLSPRPSIAALRRQLRVR